MIDPARLLDHRFDALRQSYDARDVILYALGIGLGGDPLDAFDLDRLLETRLSVLPAFAGTLASPGMWIRDPAFGIDFARLVHAEQDTRFHAALPVAGAVVATPRVASLHDRGEGRGAVLVVEREVRDADDDMLYATVRQTLLLRGDGGYGGEQPPAAPAAEAPAREPDRQISFATSPRAALIYRLSGDWNPLHADPVVARKAGFDRPILHGLASYGVAAYLIERETGQALTRLACRFSGVVLPGDVIDLSLWLEDGHCLWEAHVADRRVLDRGIALFAD